MGKSKNTYVFSIQYKHRQKFSSNIGIRRAFKNSICAFSFFIAIS